MSEVPSHLIWILTFMIAAQGFVSAFIFPMVKQLRLRLLIACLMVEFPFCIWIIMPGVSEQVLGVSSPLDRYVSILIASYFFLGG